MLLVLWLLLLLARFPAATCLKQLPLALLLLVLPMAAAVMCLPWIALQLASSANSGVYREDGMRCAKHLGEMLQPTPGTSQQVAFSSLGRVQAVASPDPWLRCCPGHLLVVHYLLTNLTCGMRPCWSGVRVCWSDS